MAKDNLLLGLVIGAVAYMLIAGGGLGVGTGVTPSGDISLCDVVEPSISFTGQRIYQIGTRLDGEHVRVLKMDGGTISDDLGTTSLNQGTQATEPEEEYTLIYGENSSLYYSQVEAYTGVCKDAADAKIARLCYIDTTPTLTVKNENGLVQVGGGTNVQAIGASEVVEGSVKVKVSADECYGNPGATGTNAICFRYNETIDSVKLTKKGISTPTIVSNNASAVNWAIDCFELNKLADLESELIEFSVEATSRDPGPKNITIIVTDIGFDLDQEDLSQIWDYEDEDDNKLGASRMTQTWFAYS